MSKLTKNNLNYIKNSAWFLIPTVMLAMILMFIGASLKFAFNEHKIAQIVIIASIILTVIFMILLTIDLKIRSKARILYSEAKETGDANLITTLTPILYPDGSKDSLSEKTETSTDYSVESD